MSEYLATLKRLIQFICQRVLGMSRALIYTSGICLLCVVHKMLNCSRVFSMYKPEEALEAAPLSREEFEKKIDELFQGRPLINGLKPIPIVYSHEYNINFWSFAERWHPFDTRKWGKVYANLKSLLDEKNVTAITPTRHLSDKELGLMHTKEFLRMMNTDTAFIGNAAEVFFLRFLPMSSLQSRLVTPIKWQVAGSILAARLALSHGWGINIGGGFHHASAHKAEGFCLFSDISLIMKMLWRRVDPDLKFMVIDLDAHQGNGYARDVQVFPAEQVPKVYILDVYNSEIYPHDDWAKQSINRKVEISSSITEREHLQLIETNLNISLTEFEPNLIIYNAGTDCLIGDPLGRLNLGADAIVIRDEMVFRAAKQRNIPVVMLTSGGYQQSNADIIADSIKNLYLHGLIA